MTSPSSRSRYYNLSVGSSITSSLPTNTCYSRTTLTISTTATPSIATTSASTIHFDDPDRHHPISYSFLVVMGLLVMLPALVAYATMDQSLQQRFVGQAQPSPQARRRWTFDDYQQRHDFLQPLYGIYQISQTEQLEEENTSTTTFNPKSKSQHQQTNNQVLKLIQSSSSSRLPQASVPSLAQQFWSVTTLAPTLIAKTTPTLTKIDHQFVLPKP